MLRWLGSTFSKYFGWRNPVSGSTEATSLEDTIQSIDLSYPFTAAESIHIPREPGTHVVPVLHELTTPRAADVLPAERLHFRGARTI